MMYRLLYSLSEVVSGFNVFRYITFRAALAALTALVVSWVMGPWLIRRLRQFQVGQSIREEGPATHQVKSGTPTMGGLLILNAILISTLLWGDLQNPLVILCLASMIAFGLIGFVDDRQKLRRRRNLGLTAAQKMGLQLVTAAAIGGLLVWLSAEGLYDTRVGFPFFKSFRPDFGIGYVAFAMLVLVSSANAVNLTDGLDGLAVGTTGIAAATYTALAYVVGHAIAAEYLGVANVRLAGEVTVFCAAVVGAALGFLWFNAHPAEIFMGDVGSMGLGGAIGAVALVIKQEVLLVIVGGVFVLEAASVMVQVASFKATGKRVFKMAPLHHHFEAHRPGAESYLRGGNWEESKVVARFWILAILFALTGLSTLKVR